MISGRLLAIARKEALQLRRDRRSLMLAFLLPMALILFFGYAISFDITNIEIAVLDYDRTPTSRKLVQVFESSGYFQVERFIERSSEIDALLLRGSVRAVMVIPPHFAQDLSSGSATTLQLVLDGADANTATIAQNYADVIVAGFSAEMASSRRTPSIALPIEPDIRIWYNETLASTHMIVPGLVAVIMSIIAALLTALTIAREWERGTMEQLAASPVHRTEVVLGKLVPYIGIGLFDVVLAIVAGTVVFGVPLRGNILLLGIFTLLFLVGALSFGIFLSAALKSQVLATQAAMLSTYLPSLLLSGFMFSIASMPIALRAITFLVPARYYIVITRGIFLKDVGIDVLWTQGMALVLYSVVGLALATASFKKEIA